MIINFSLKPESVAILGASSKADVLNQLAEIFARAWSLDQHLVLEHLEEREALGSTGFGKGVAIPHARIPGIHRPIAAVIKLERPVDFDAADGLAIDLVIGLLSPDQSGVAHLQALAAASRLVRDERIHDALVNAPNAEALYSLIANVTDRDAA